MKKQLRAISKKVVTFLLAAYVAVLSQAVYASPDSTLKKGPEITYAGIVESKLAFNINYKNELSQAFKIVIKNDQDFVIYSKHFDARPLHRTILFSEFTDNRKLTFYIIMGKKEIVQAFKIDAHIKTEEVFIVKGI